MADVESVRVYVLEMQIAQIMGKSERTSMGIIYF